MYSKLEPRFVSSVLRSGRVLFVYSNAAAILAGLGYSVPQLYYTKLILAASLSFWIAGSWFAARVFIDSELFQVLAEDPEQAAPALDTFLNRIGLIAFLIQLGVEPPAPNRSIEERAKGSLKLWKLQILCFAIQLGTFALAALLWNIPLLQWFRL